MVIKTEIEALQRSTASTVTPQDFAPEGAIGLGAGRRLSADYGTKAEAIVQYPLCADEINAGALTDMSHDWCALQTMSRHVNSLSYSLLQLVPAGDYIITDTWKITEGNVFKTAYVRGVGQGYGTGFEGSHIDAKLLTDVPAVSIQGARVVTLENISLEGGNAAAEATTNGILSNVEGDWITAGLSSGRYNPYAGIAIDPYTTQPGSGEYTNDPYGRNKSSTVFIDNVRVGNFVVGVVVSPSADGDNADQVIMTRCFMHFNTFALSSGGSQNRTLVFDSGYIYGAYQACVNAVHGNQDGNCWQLYRTTCIRMWELFNWTNATQPIIQACHIEDIARLGTWSGEPLNSKIAFSDCEIKFAHTSGQFRPVDRFELIGRATAVFEACLIQNASEAGSPNVGVVSFTMNPGSHIFYQPGTYFYFPGASALPIVSYSYNGRYTASFNGCATTQLGTPLNQRSLNDKAVYAPSDGTHALPDRIVANWTTQEVIGGGNSYRYVAGNLLQNINIPGISNQSISSTELIFDTTAPENFRIDDLIAADCTSTASGLTQPKIVAKVTSIVSSTVTCELICDESEVTDPLGTIVQVQYPEFAPKVSPEATCSTSSADITFASDISGIFEEGDWIQGDTGTWGNYRVDTVSGDGLTITLNKNAPITGTAKVFWGRLYELVGTAQ